MSQLSSELIGPSQAARVAGVSSQSIRNWAREGRLPATKTGIGLVFERGTVERFARERAARQQSGRK